MCVTPPYTYPYVATVLRLRAFPLTLAYAKGLVVLFIQHKETKHQ